MRPDLRDAGYLDDMLRFSREDVAIAADTVSKEQVRGRALERTIASGAPHPGFAVPLPAGGERVAEGRVRGANLHARPTAPES